MVLEMPTHAVVDACYRGMVGIITWRNLNFFARLRQIIALLFGAIRLFH